MLKLKYPLNFKSDKYLLYEASPEHVSGRRFYYFVNAVNVFCWYSLLKNIYRLRLFRALFWMIPTAFSTNGVVGFRRHFESMVTKMELMDSGKEVHITYLSGHSEQISVSLLQYQSQDFLKNLNQFGTAGLQLYPLRIGGARNVNLDKNGRIENEEVFRAVCNGWEIDLRETKNAKGEREFIDIE